MNRPKVFPENVDVFICKLMYKLIYENEFSLIFGMENEEKR